MADRRIDIYVTEIIYAAAAIRKQNYQGQQAEQRLTNYYIGGK